MTNYENSQDFSRPDASKSYSMNEEDLGKEGNDETQDAVIMEKQRRAN